MLAKVRSLAAGRFYYGWVIVAVGFITGLVVITFRLYSFGVFVKPLSEDMGWSRTSISSVLSFSTIVEGVVAFAIGPILDKRGSRLMLVVGIALSGVGFIALGLVQSLWQFYLIRGLVIGIGFTCGGNLAINVAISNWFVRMRGRAVSIGLMGAALGGAVMTPLAAWLISLYGWRSAWMVCGAIMLLVAIPPAAIFVKRRPEDIGLLPDGDDPMGVVGEGSGAGMGAGHSAGGQFHHPSHLAPVPPTEAIWTRKEAMRTPALWLTMFACGFGSLAATAMALHFQPYLSDVGLGEMAAATVYSVYALSAAAFKPVWGMVIDKFGVRRGGIAAFAIAALALPIVSLFPHWPSLWLAFPASILAGISIAGQVPVQEVLWANYFGRLSLGAVRSIASPFAILFSAGGPIFAGWCYDHFGSYVFAWVSFAVTYVIAAALVYLSRAPRKAQKNGDQFTVLA